MELAVVILNWNAAAETIRCVQAAASWKRLRPTIWVVDNGSTNGSADAISRACPNLPLIRNPANLGFAGGNNRGIVQALSVGDAPILLLNNDAFIEEGDVLRLMDTLQADERLGLVGPLLFDADGEGQLLSAGGRDIAKSINTHICEISGGGAVCEVDYVPGTAVLVRSAVFRVVGLFDEDYFFSGEVADLCQRARRYGYVSAVDTRARAFHSLARSSDLRERLYVYYNLRNRFLFIRKFYHARMIPLYIFWALYGLGASLKAQLGGRVTRARAIRLALLDGLRGRFGGQNERVLSTSPSAARRSPSTSPSPESPDPRI